MIDLSTGYIPNWVDVENACPYCQEKAKQYGAVKCDCSHNKYETSLNESVETQTALDKDTALIFNFLSDKKVSRLLTGHREVVKVLHNSKLYVLVGDEIVEIRDGMSVDETLWVCRNIHLFATKTNAKEDKLFSLIRSFQGRLKRYLSRGDYLSEEDKMKYSKTLKALYWLRARLSKAMDKKLEIERASLIAKMEALGMSPTIMSPTKKRIRIWIEEEP